MLYELFVVGGILFWALTIAVLCLLMFCVDSERTFGAAVSIVLYLVFINVFGNANTLAWIKENSTLTIVGVVGYLFAGVFWSFGKWYFFNKEISEKVLIAKRKLLGPAANEDTEIPEDRLSDWHFMHLATIHYKDRTIGKFPIRALEHKERITNWMMYWPISAAWTLLDDFVRNLYKKIYSTLQARYEAITNKIFGKFHEKDFAPLPSPSPIEKDENAGGFRQRRGIKH